MDVNTRLNIIDADQIKIMKQNKKVVAIKVDGCAHHNLVITGEMLKEQGYFIPSDIRKVHITFNTEKK